VATNEHEADALPISLAEVTTRRLSEEVATNSAPNEQAVGVEILNASECTFGESKPGY
jgi:uncharacterized protein YuzE